MLPEKRRWISQEIQQLRGISNNSFMKCFIHRALKGTADNSVKNIGVDALSWKRFRSVEHLYEWRAVWCVFLITHSQGLGLTWKSRLETSKSVIALLTHSPQPTETGPGSTSTYFSSCFLLTIQGQSSFSITLKTSILWRPNRGLIEVSFLKCILFRIPLLPHVRIPVGSPLFTQLNWKLILRFTIYSFNTIYIFKKLQVGETITATS